MITVRFIDKHNTIIILLKVSQVAMNKDSVTIISTFDRVQTIPYREEDGWLYEGQYYTKLEIETHV